MFTTKRRLPVMAFAGLFAIASPQAFAFSDVVEGVTYTLGCAGLMLRDPAEHVAQCNPKFPSPQPSSLASSGGGGSAPIGAPATSAPAPAPVPVPIPVPVAIPVPEPVIVPAEPAPPVIPEPEPCAVGAFLGWGETALVASLDIELAQQDPCGGNNDPDQVLL